MGFKAYFCHSMALILGIETSTDTCSVALGSNGIVLKELNNFEGNKHASQLQIMVKNVLEETGFNLSNLEAIAVSKGPGSYTGLRVGVSAAKGYAYALQIPVIALNSLVSMANKFIIENQPDCDFIIPMIDARRMEVYSATYNKALTEIAPIRAQIVSFNTFDSIPLDTKAIFIGNGAIKCQELLQRPSFTFLNFPCGASGLISLAELAYSKKDFENTAYFEPYYLKEFVGTSPSKK
jgi:tRNA threonylcarbamoyladenosine biosynthesis protein TsaB